MNAKGTLVLVAALSALLLSAACDGVSDEECKQDPQCWGERHDLEAARACNGPLEDKARAGALYDYNVGYAPVAFVAKPDEITYLFEADFWNAFGSKEPYTGVCTYDPATETANGVQFLRGRHY